MFAVIDPDTCTCGPTCKAKLFAGLKHLQEFQTHKKENRKQKQKNGPAIRKFPYLQPAR